MRMGFTADWHSDDMKRTYLIDGIPNRELDMDKQIKSIVDFFLKKKITYLFVLGDIFDKSKVDGYYFSKVIDYLRMFTENHIEVIIIPGNHDATESGSSITLAIEKLKDENIEVIDEADFYTFDDKYDFLILPHEKKKVFQDFNSYTDYVQDIIKDREEDYVVIGHFQPLSAIPGSEEEMFSGSTRYLDTSIFGDNKVFCGHVHRAQQLGNVYIPGSLVRFNLGDREQDKGLYLYDAEKDKVVFKKLNPQRISKISLDFTEDFSLITAEEAKKYKGQMVGINIDTNKENKDMIDYKAIVEVLESAGAKVVSYNVKTHKDNQMKKSSSDDKMSPLDVFKRIVKKHVSKNNRKRIFNLGREILGECHDN